MSTAAKSEGEDPAALLRPFVEAAGSGEPPRPALTALAAARAREIDELAPARLYALLTPPLCDRHPHVALQWAQDADLLVRILPEVSATVALAQEGGRRHKDVWEHTKLVTAQAVPRPVVRWAALLHDIGKAPTRRFVGGKVTFHGHAEVGAALFRQGPAQRIGFPAAIRGRVEALILHHLRPGQYDARWTDAAVRRFARELGPHLRDLLDLSRADITSRRPGQRRRCLTRISELAARIRTLAERDARRPRLPSGLGHALMRAFDLPPGPHIGVLRDRLAQLSASGEIPPDAPVERHLEVVRAHGWLADLGVNRGPRSP